MSLETARRLWLPTMLLVIAAVAVVAYCTRPPRVDEVTGTPTPYVPTVLVLPTIMQSPNPTPEPTPIPPTETPRPATPTAAVQRGSLELSSR